MRIPVEPGYSTSGIVEKDPIIAANLTVHKRSVAGRRAAPTSPRHRHNRDDLFLAAPWATLEVSEPSNHGDHLNLAQSSCSAEDRDRTERHGRACSRGFRADGVRQSPVRRRAQRTRYRTGGSDVVPGDGDLEQAVGDVCLFLSALEGLSSAAADRAVLPFPSHEIDPYRGLAPHVGVTSTRARALHALAGATARVIVASAAALLPRVSAPDRLLDASIDLRPGQEISPADLGELLVDAGFSREDPADEHGEFAVRGGIVDVYPPGEGSARPARVHRRHDRIAAHLRPGHPAVGSGDRSDPDRSTARHLVGRFQEEPPQDVKDPEGAVDILDRSATFFDYLTRAKGVADHPVRERRGRGKPRQAVRTDPAQLRGSGRTSAGSRLRPSSLPTGATCRHGWRTRPISRSSVWTTMRRLPQARGGRTHWPRRGQPSGP